MGSDKARPAYVEDVLGDEDSDNNRTIRNTRVSARASKKEKKQRNEKRVAKEKKKSQSDDGYSSLAVPTRADERATVKEIRVIPDREPREGRRKSLNINPGKSPRKSSRPPTQRTVTFDHSDLPSRPKDRDDPRYFGQTRGGHPVVIQAQSTPRAAPSSAASSQSRPSRATSISSNNISRPPLSGSAHFYAPSPLYTAPIMIPPQYQNPMQMAFSPSRTRVAEPQDTRGPIRADWPSSDLQLVQRGVYDDDDEEDDDDDYDSEEEERNQAAIMQEAARMREARRRAKEQQDALDMPPPQPMQRRRSVRQPSEQSIFLQDNLDDELQPHPATRDYDHALLGTTIDVPLETTTDVPSGDYERPSPRRPSPDRRLSHAYEFNERERPAQPKITYRGDAAPPSRARRQSLPRAPESNESLSFAHDRDDANIRIEGATGARPSSYGPLSNSSSNYEDKIRDAAGYQADVSGGEPIKLTADLLRKQQNTIGSSRSTHSSNSRDESDFKRSVTTRTTRSVSGNDAGTGGDDVTVRIKGNPTVTIGAAENTNADGVELNIVNNRRQSIRNGSEASTSEYAPSQSGQSQPPLSESKDLTELSVDLPLLGETAIYYCRRVETYTITITSTLHETINFTTQPPSSWHPSPTPSQPFTPSSPPSPAVPPPPSPPPPPSTPAPTQPPPPPATPATNAFSHGSGTIQPTSVPTSAIFALIGIICAGFVITGIWFFFIAKNGGFHFRQGDWEDYKSTVLRRKGPNGTTLSGATRTTDLGGGSVVGKRYRDSESSVLSSAYTEQTESLVGTETVVSEMTSITRGVSGRFQKEKTERSTATSAATKEQRKRFREKGDKREKSRLRDAESVGGDELEGDDLGDAAMSSYRHEKPARVGGMNRAADGSAFESSVGGSEESATGLLAGREATPTNSPQKVRRVRERGGEGYGAGSPSASPTKERAGIRKVETVREADRIKAEARRLREKGRSAAGRSGGGRRDF
ncbi:hypothetical protein VE04_09732, partial [Pseudogymnoascus sp. 24MN13]